MSRIASWREHAEPLVQGYAAIKPLYVCAELIELCPGSLTTCLGALTSKDGLVRGCQGSRTIFRVGGTLNVFPLMR